MSDLAYPPEPWDLRGDLHAAILLVPVRELPRAITDTLPPGHTLVRLGARAVVGVAWVDYTPGGVLSYRELMATVLVRRGPRLRPSITHIWVDSAASRDGGRALWSIPKGLATFGFGPRDTAARDTAARDTAARDLAAHDPQPGPAGPVASGTVRTLVRVPGRWPVRFSVAQRALTGPALAVVSPVRSRARVALTRPTLDAAAAGPLGFLHGHRPFVGVSMQDFRMLFGSGRT